MNGQTEVPTTENAWAWLVEVRAKGTKTFNIIKCIIKRQVFNHFIWEIQKLFKFEEEALYSICNHFQ